MNTSFAYLAKDVDSLIGRKCTAAAPPMTVTSTDEVFETAETFLVSRHPTRSDLFPCITFPYEISDGGYFWLSCLKYSWLSPSSLAIKKIVFLIATTHG